MGKQSIWVVMGGLVAVSACGARQTSSVSATYTETVSAASACSLDVSIDNAWSDDDGHHFLKFDRIGEDRRQVAIEYFVPKDGASGSTMRIYDRKAGSHFKITAHPRSWRIHGEPSTVAHCHGSGSTIALGAQQ